MREHCFTYRQIVAVLKAEHGIVIGPVGNENIAARHLASIIKRLGAEAEQQARQRQLFAGGSPANGTGNSKQIPPQVDPIESARTRYNEGRRSIFERKG
jgi:hypothetical protein